ncbi:hypothetical protein U1Q18_029188 [Sarracenia purpurea var. burkii]
MHAVRHLLCAILLFFVLLNEGFSMAGFLQLRSTTPAVSPFSSPASPVVKFHRTFFFVLKPATSAASPRRFSACHRRSSRSAPPYNISPCNLRSTCSDAHRVSVSHRVTVLRLTSTDAGALYRRRL